MRYPDYINSMLAQESSGIALPGDGLPTAPGTTQGPNGAAPATGPMGSQFFLVVLLVLGAMILFSIFGQRRDKKKRESMLSALRKHDKVQTIGGVIGSVVEVKPDLVVLKVDESSNTRITITRSAIQQVLSPTGTEPAAKDESA